LRRVIEEVRAMYNRSLRAAYQRPLREFIFFDLETTGLSPRADNIIEFAALRVGRGGRIYDSFEALVRIDRQLPPFITKLTGISDDMLCDKYPINVTLPEFLDFIGDRVLVSYNIPFDMGFLRTESSRLRLPVNNATMCALQIARKKLPDLQDHKLQTVAQYYGYASDQTHRALDDCQMALDVFVNLMRS
jgi:DNA polymerase III subunit alpha, Gram-positive type